MQVKSYSMQQQQQRPQQRQGIAKATTILFEQRQQQSLSWLPPEQLLNEYNSSNERRRRIHNSNTQKSTHSHNRLLLPPLPTANIHISAATAERTAGAGPLKAACLDWRRLPAHCAFICCNCRVWLASTKLAAVG